MPNCLSSGNSSIVCGRLDTGSFLQLSVRFSDSSLLGGRIPLVGYSQIQPAPQCRSSIPHSSASARMKNLRYSVNGTYRAWPASGMTRLSCDPFLSSPLLQIVKRVCHCTRISLRMILKSSKFYIPVEISVQPAATQIVVSQRLSYMARCISSSSLSVDAGRI